MRERQRRIRKEGQIEKMNEGKKGDWIKLD